RSDRDWSSDVCSSDLWAPRMDGAGVTFEIEADRFMHRMVRFLVGLMVDIALGRRPQSDLSTLLSASDNQAASPPAPPQGLYLAEIGRASCRERVDVWD